MFGTYEGKTLVLSTMQATNGSGYNTSRAAARVGSGASPPFFEKKVLPLKLPFPKNFSKGKKNIVLAIIKATNGSGYNTFRAVARIGTPAIGGGRHAREPQG